MSTHPSSTRTLIEEYLTAVNTHDWTTLERVFHPDVVAQHGQYLTSEGRDKVIRLLQAVTGQFEKHEDRPTRFIVEGDSAAVEITFFGTLPDGREVTFPAADVIDTDGTQITRVVSWYDTAAVLPMLQPETASA